MHLKANEITLARLLQRAGYATCLIGKWHLSGGFDLAGQPTPGDHGFDYWFATQNVAVPSHRDPENFYRNGKAVGKVAGYSAQIVAAEAADWLANKRDKSKPFFLFLPLHEPHEKIATDPRFLKLFPSPNDPSRAEFWGNISQIDDGFGRLMKTLDDLKLADDTRVFFTSDNGAGLTAQHPHGSTGGLRGKKSQMYEGGVRVPGLLRWPGRIRAGQTSDEPVSGIDVLPTFCALAKVAPPADRPIDGASFLPVFEGKPMVRKTPLYWQFHRADGRHKVAMRVGDWKLYATITGPQLNSNGDILQEDLDSLNLAQLDSFALYHLGKDREEMNDLAASEKERVAEMAVSMRNLFDEVRKESPRWPTWLRFPAKGDIARKASRTSPRDILADAKKSANVGRLNLNFTTTTDADLKELAEMKGVCMLDLSGTDVTDAGLETLANFKQLQSVDLRRTSVSESAVEKLRKKVPGLSIQR